MRARTVTHVVAGLMLSTVVVAQEPAQLSEREQRFEELMNGAELVGEFTATLPSGVSPPRPDTYSVSRLRKLDDGRWLFVAAMSYGDNVVEIPMPFHVEWAGDTPVITLTDQTIEGLGTFSARVVVYDGLYAGTWKHAAFGGHLWGRIQKPAAAGAP